MLKKLSLLLFLFFALPAHAQTLYSNACPAGFVPIIGPTTVTINNATGQYIYNQCVDNSGNIKIWNPTTSSWSDPGGGNGVGSGASPIVGWYLGPNCPVANTGQCYNTPADTQIDNTCSWTGTTVTCSDGPFAAGDVGKYIMGRDSGSGVYGGCSSFASSFGGSWITTTHTTISAYISATQVTTANTVTSASTTTAACVVWGTPDDTGTSALETAIASATSCPHVILEARHYLWTTSHFFSNPKGCYNLPGQWPYGNGSGNLGNTMLPIGFELSGAGAGNTTIFLPPDFPETGTCNHAIYDTGVIQTCFVVAPLGYWHDFSIASIPLTSTGLPPNVALLQIGVGRLDNWACFNSGSRVTGTVGITRSEQQQIHNVNVAYCGNIGMTMQASTGTSGSGVWPASADIGLAFDNNKTANVSVAAGGVFRCVECFFSGGQESVASPGSIGIFNHGGTVWLHNSSINQPKNGQSVNFPTGYFADTSGSVLYADYTTFEYNTSLTGQGNNNSQFGIKCTAACTNHLFNSWLQGSVKNGGVASAYQDVAGSIFDDQGGNQFFCSVGTGGGTCNPPAPSGAIIALGGGSNAGQTTTAKTNFGTNLTAQTINASTAYANNLRVTFTLRQTTLGVGCGAGSNTVQGTLAWTTNGLAQTQTTSTLTISANGTMGTSVFQVIPVRPDANTAVTFTTTSVLASAGCSTVPQYQVDASI